MKSVVGGRISKLIDAVGSSGAALLATLALLIAIPVKGADCVQAPSGQVAWWRAEGNAVDIIGHNVGIPANGASFTNGEVGQGFVFDRVASYVRVPATPALDLGQGDGLTVEAWVNPTNAGLGQPVIEWDQGGGGTFGVHFWVGHPSNPPGYFMANIVDTSGGWHIIDTVPGLIRSNVFQHVALTYDKASGVAELWLNGVVVSQSNLGTFTPQTSYDVYIGSRAGTDSPAPFAFGGIIDELGLYSRALSTNEIQSIYAAGTAGKCVGPVPPFIATPPINMTVFAGDQVTMPVVAEGAPSLNYWWYYDGNEIIGATNATLVLTNVQPTQNGQYSVLVSNSFGSVPSSGATLTVLPLPSCTNPPSGLLSWWRAENDARDSVGGNDGKLMNAAGFAAGAVRQAFAFDGTNQYVEVPDSPTLDPVAGLTVEAWVYLSNYAGSPMAVVSKDDEAANRQYMLNVVGSATNPVFRANVKLPTGYFSLTGTNGIPASTWTHAAMTFDGTSLKLYYNGALDSSLSVTGLLAKTSRPLRIGRGGPGSYFAGNIDEVSLYGRALSNSEVQGLVSAGAGKCVAPVAPFILSNPTNLTVTLGNNAMFAITAGGSVPLSYQWSTNGVPLAEATKNPLVVTNARFPQAGAYSVVIANSAGSVTSSIANLTLVYPPAGVLLGSTNVIAGSSVLVPVSLVANGNENAMAFSLAFDPTKLTFSAAFLGSGAAGAVLLSNTNLVNSGKLGLALAMPSNTSSSPGTQQVVQVSFTAAVLTNAASTTISFGDQPTVRQLWDNQLNSLPATYGGAATIAIAPASFEGDLFPRPNGDKLITLSDWLLMGRYVARLDYPTNAAEFQRADCAPRSTFGDGAIKVTDWVQLGRFAFGLDPWAVAAGPTNEIAGSVVGPSALRSVSVGAATLVPNQPCTISVSLTGQGNENALGFSLSFDPQRVTFGSASLGSGAAGATLYANSTQAASGQLGLALILGTGGSFAAGSNELVRLNFLATSSGSGSFAPAFTDLPVPREISDPGANALPASYLSGMPVSLMPSLRIAHSGSTITVAWPLWANTFSLQQASGTLTPNSVWTNVPTAIFTNNNEITVTLPPTNTASFYRLYHP